MPEDYEKAYNGILAAVKDGTITEDRINESLTRIYRVKYADKINESHQKKHRHHQRLQLLRRAVLHRLTVENEE
jgi:beta-glucosidase-like glycosyl hydrolase